MKIAIAGSRTVTEIGLDGVIPTDCTEIVSGGAKGIDSDVEKYAEKKGIKMTVFKPDYRRFRGGATHIRNRQIVDYADEVIAFWDGSSRGTSSVIEYCLDVGKKVAVVTIEA